MMNYQGQMMPPTQNQYMPNHKPQAMPQQGLSVVSFRLSAIIVFYKYGLDIKLLL